ncbi:D-alanine--D-alanine ligase [Phycisphaerales bacterium AB-hyl4]|uniref:D-alanine--D-alanine ligase n=1 Tax=Natronomicrosphaera hydrolytica TaxID=3242702 RepID=A0ABV4U931_9BACT
MAKRRQKLRILVLMHEDLVPPESVEGLSEKEIAPFKTEFDVCATLREMGHEVRPLGVSSDLSVIREANEQWQPNIAFNLLEEFDGVGVYDAHVVSYLELLRLPYTGCNPRGLMLAHDKALTKMILRHHRIGVPRFAVFPLDRKVRRPKRLAFPLLVKSLTEEGSVGISQASIVYDDDKLAERVAFVHRTCQTDAIAEQYIDGREMYVGVLGNERLFTLPIWELTFTKLREAAPRIATGRIKWDYKYQEKVGIETQEPTDLSPAEKKNIHHFCKRVYRALSLSGYARMDLRLNPEGQVFLIEANPNPQLAYGEDFAESAEAVGVGYEDLLQKILNLGLRYRLRGQA